MAGQILYKLSLDSAQFQSSLTKAQKNLNDFAKGMQSTGRSMSTYLTAPLTLMGGAGVMAWDKQAKAMAQVQQGLKTTQGAVGLTFEQLKKHAADLEDKTLFGDEDILKNATAQLLTFTNIVGSEFKRAQSVALDLATRLDGDLKGSAIMLGKALNDPVQGLSAMKRVGISFTDSQGQMIKSLAESGNLMQAQNLILDELQRQYGGSAEAAVVGAGKITQLKNSVGTLMEEFGRIIMEYLTPFIEKMKEMTKYFMSLDESTKRSIVKFAALAAGIGPALIAIGSLVSISSKLIGIFKSVSTVMAAITSPVGLIVAGIVALGAATIYLWQNWEAVKERISDWAWWRNTLVEMVKFMGEMTAKIIDLMLWPIRKVSKLLGLEIPSMADTFKPLFLELDSLKTEPKKYEHAFGSFSDAIKGSMKDAAKSLGFLNNEIAASIDNMAKVGKMSTDVQISITEKLVPFSVKSITGPKVESPVFETDKLNTWAEALRAKTGEVKQAVVDMAAVIKPALEDMFVGFGESLGSLIAGTGNIKTFFNGLLDTVLNFTSMFGKALISAGIGAMAFKKLMLQPEVAIAAGVALVALSSAVRGIMSKGLSGSSNSSVYTGPSLSSVTKLAKGGLAYSPILATVGDNINAANDPEVIAPLSKLRDYMGFGGGSGVKEVQFRFNGQDFIGYLNLENDRIMRGGGGGIAQNWIIKR